MKAGDQSRTDQRRLLISFMPVSLSRYSLAESVPQPKNLQITYKGEGVILGRNFLGNDRN